jgi:hypothetical protein
MHGIQFGIDRRNGRPFVDSPRGRAYFVTVDDAASFVERRVRVEMNTAACLWDTLESDLDELNAELVTKSDDEVPF